MFLLKINKKKTQKKKNSKTSNKFKKDQSKQYEYRNAEGGNKCHNYTKLLVMS